MKRFSLALLFMSSISMAAGLKVNWKVQVFEGTAATPAALLETWTFAARKSDVGVLTQLSSGLWQLPLRAAAMAGLKGRVSVTAMEVLGDSGTLRLQLWDTSELPDSSPRYRTFFQSDVTLSAGKASPIAFTLGDASLEGAFERYWMVVSLESIAKEP